MSEELENNQGQLQEPSPAAAAATPPSDSLARALEEIRSLRKQTEAAAATTAAVARVAFQQRAQPAPVEEEPEELDPAVQRALDKRMREVEQREMRFVQERMQRDAMQERADLARHLAELGEAERIAEIDEYMDQNGVPLEMRAAPGAYLAAYQHLEGRKAVAAKREAIKKPAGGAPPSRPVEAAPIVVSPVEQAAAERINRRMGVVVNKEEAELFDRAEVSITDYMALLEKQRAKEGRR